MRALCSNVLVPITNRSRMRVRIQGRHFLPRRLRFLQVPDRATMIRELEQRKLRNTKASVAFGSAKVAVGTLQLSCGRCGVLPGRPASNAKESSEAVPRCRQMLPSSKVQANRGCPEKVKLPQGPRNVNAPRPFHPVSSTC